MEREDPTRPRAETDEPAHPAPADLAGGSLALLRALPDAVLVCDLEGTIRQVNDEAERLFGYPRDELVGAPIEMLVPDGRTPAHRRHRERYAATEHPRPMITGPGIEGLRKDGSRVPIEVNLASVDLGGRPAIVASVRDETARREREAALARSEERFRRLFEDAAVGVALVAARPPRVGAVTRANRALAEMVGHPAEALVGRSVAAVAHPEDVHLVESAIGALLHDAGDTGDTGDTGDAERPEVRLVHADGHDVWSQAVFSVVRDESGAPDYVVAMLADITDRKRAEAELRHHALHDPLTGLPNRSLVTQALEDALVRSRLAGTGAGVLYVDVDHFKQVNDSLGHAAGDELLVEVARRLEGCMRDSDVAGRFASDEFVVVCDSVGSAGDMVAVAARVARTLAIRLPLAGEMVTVSASIGIGYSADASAEPRGLLHQADAAAYRAKADGGAKFEFADAELQTIATRRVEIEADLRRLLGSVGGPDEERVAAEVGELFLDYQPCFSAVSGCVVACEALLRWRHPSRGLLGPGEFLDVAEDRGLMVPLGTWVLRTACRRAASWQEALGPDAPEVWVNVSAAQLGRPRFAEVVARTLDETGLAPERLWLEITERQALSTAAATYEDLEALAAMGVRLAVDDFGTGYAGLEYLRRLPVSGLKVDASYVAAIGTDPTGAALAATVVGLGRALDLTVVAEGIETPEQRSVVVELGVDVLQGFLLARPGRPEVVPELVLAEATSDALGGGC